MKERLLIKGEVADHKGSDFLCSGWHSFVCGLELTSVSDKQKRIYRRGVKKIRPGQGESLYEIEVEGLDEEKCQ